MFCPICKCEYIRGVTQCADCGVPLVDALKSPETSSPEGVQIVAIWQGNDPSECERVKEALENAEIQYMDRDSNTFQIFLPLGSKLEIWVSHADRDKAKKVVDDLEGRIDPDELTPEEIESLALPESDQMETEDQTDQPQNLPENWYEDEPVTEIWSGDAETFADTLIACLREVGIASRRLSEGGRCRLVVRSEQQARAKEIVREVEEASPPQ
jgi:hypothetical protein